MEGEGLVNSTAPSQNGKTTRKIWTSQISLKLIFAATTSTRRTKLINSSHLYSRRYFLVDPRFEKLPQSRFQVFGRYSSLWANWNIGADKEFLPAGLVAQSR